MIEKNGYIVVEKGDTLSGIAAKLGKSTREMMALNPSLKSADRIWAGQKLKSATRLSKPKIAQPAATPAAQSTPPSAGAADADGAAEPLTKRERVAQALEETPSEPVSNAQDAECCCRLEMLQIIQPKRGADSEGKGGSTYTMDVVKLQGQKNVAKPTNKEKGTFELYITAPPFKSDGTPDTKSLSFPHAFHKPKCELEISLKSKRMEKIAKDEIKIDSYSLIEGGVDFKPPKSTYYNPNPRAHRNNYSYKNEWNLSRLIKLATAQDGLYEVYDVLPKGSSKCHKQATLYVAKAFKLDGEAKLSYTGESDVWAAENYIDSVARQQTQQETKLTLSFDGDTIEFTSKAKFTMAKPKGKGVLRTVPTKELFGDFAKYFDPLYAAVEKTKHPPTGLKRYKPTIQSKLGACSFTLKAGNIQAQEIPQSYEVGVCGDLTLGMDIFDGSAIEIDLIPAVTASVDKVKYVINAALKRSGSKSGVDGEVVLKLTINGGIGGETTLSKTVGAKNYTVKGALNAKVTAILEAKIEASLDMLVIKTKAGAYGMIASEGDNTEGFGIKGELSFSPPKEGKELDYNGDITCTGAEIYFGAYIEISDSHSHQTAQNTQGGGRDNDEDEEIPIKREDETGFKLEKSSSFVLMHAFSFKKLLRDLTPPPALVQYETADINGLYRDGSSMDNDSTIQSYTIPNNL